MLRGPKSKNNKLKIEEGSARKIALRMMSLMMKIESIGRDILQART